MAVTTDAVQLLGGYGYVCDFPVERMMREAGIEVGGVEYVIDDKTGRLLYYDLNALSNFVADPVRMIGFNPYERLADYLMEDAGQRG